jgi:hypothetical protein
MVKKLLPELEKLETYESDWSAFDPVKTIELAETLLEHKIQQESVYRQAAKYMDYAFQCHIEDNVNEREYYLNTLPTYALEEVLFWDQSYRNTLDEEVTGDFAHQVLKVYAGIDENPPWIWVDVLYSNGNNPDYVPLRYDLTKTLEFWEWWLTEAVPLACDKALHSVRTELVKKLLNFYR